MRILITGPESTGKSSLALAISEKLGLPLFPEYARTYLENKVTSDYSSSDILSIAQQHHELIEIFPADQGLVLDTYLLNLKIWMQVKYDLVHPWLLERYHEATFDHILLLYPDIAWVPDPLREAPGDRLRLFDLFQTELDVANKSYHIITGQGTQRLELAMSCIS